MLHSFLWASQDVNAQTGHSVHFLVLFRTIAFLATSMSSCRNKRKTFLQFWVFRFSVRCFLSLFSPSAGLAFTIDSTNWQCRLCMEARVLTPNNFFIRRHLLLSSPNHKYEYGVLAEMRVIVMRTSRDTDVMHHSLGVVDGLFSQASLS